MLYNKSNSLITVLIIKSETIPSSKIIERGYVMALDPYVETGVFETLNKSSFKNGKCGSASWFLSN